jgi:hypothetical protein
MTDSKETEISHRVNMVRLRINVLHKTLAAFLDSHSERGSSQIAFSDIGKTINLNSIEQKHKFVHYIQEQMALNQILPDLTFQLTSNQKFNNLFATRVAEKGTVFIEGDDPVFRDFFKGGQSSQSFHSYTLMDTLLGNSEQLVYYILLREYLALTTGVQQDDLRIHAQGPDCTEGTLGLICKEFSTVFISINGSSVPGRSNLYILLWSGNMEMLSRTDSKKEKSTELGYRAVRTMTEPVLRTFDDRMPRKYDNVFYSTPPISIQSIYKLVELLDDDLDNVINVGNVKAFIKKHQLVLDEEVVALMSA